ncbi:MULTISPECIES: type II secretion system F family protein [unclassified Arsukibacterium]|uniref:type II secretion system F family protein n=1 Tax=unclassified Arsukibacterium TaxID=2635278 RepID=UPI000C37DF9A|nr:MULTISPECIES: type II secretion system F family protein [unclassified Arsukibacterium]MAA94990.1 MSHA biogenesis protein MshG [Rheinheimera sp.]MBM35396.1 MSHA biogenesis protein MshG [Rheinheimera sp.]HAW94510.1 MSHA biogenesis protein MshG [Candidatus Azambacteria bacterium]|tara:strand:- start:26021 stop:27238 length:1218 start_codon:yes stop_codon:yes gene_type:complete
MASFQYKARDASGNAVTGQLEAGSQAAAADMLKQRRYIPLSIEAIVVAEKTARFELWQAKVSLTELIIFSRQMYSLMKAGIPIIRSIKSLAESTGSPRLRQVMTDLASELENGRSLSVAMASHPKVFSRLIISLVHVGENTGRLDDAFLQLTFYFEQELETRKQIKQATRYPIFVLFALVVAMVILNIFVIPQFANMFARFNAELPWSTQLLLASSSFFITFWPLLLVLLVAAIIGVSFYLQTPAGKYRWGRWKLRVPIIGSIINRATLGRFARSFSMMLKAGVPITTALSLVAEAVDNDYLGEKIREMRRSIERGESLLRVAQQSDMFTELVLQMISVGEETGQMDEMLTEVAGFYEREVAFDLKSLTAKIEPILIVIVAAMVLLLALGIFTPMWDMLNAYKGG